jgi:hypothetical protein
MRRPRARKGALFGVASGNRLWPREESAAASGTVRPSFSIVGRSLDSRFAILIGLASPAVGLVPCSADPPRCDCSRLRMTFIDDMRTRLLEPKRALGNIRKSVGVISDAIGCNLDDGTCRLARRRSCSSAASEPQTTWTNERPCQCLLSGVDRKWKADCQNGAFDP